MPRTANARCAGSMCFSAEPQYECEYGNGWCETWVMGGGDPLPEGGYNVADTLIQRSEFLPAYIVGVPNDLMTKAGIVRGTIITHINGIFPQSLEHFAEMVQELPAGTVLKVWRSDGKRVDIQL